MINTQVLNWRPATKIVNRPVVDRHALLQQVRWMTDLLENRLTLPGINVRVGLDALIGLVPGVGDVVTTAMALYVVWMAKELGAPRWLLIRMLGNVAIDFAGGAVPLAGDLFDIAFRANSRNLRLLERFLQKNGR